VHAAEDPEQPGSQGISDIVMKAIAPDLGERYQRATELLDDLGTATDTRPSATEFEDMRKPWKAREVPKKGFCWHCASPFTPGPTGCRGIAAQLAD